jgi:hypothetical protein
MFGKELSETFCERVIGTYLSGTKQIDITVQLDILTNTVNDTIKRYKKQVLQYLRNVLDI